MKTLLISYVCVQLIFTTGMMVTEYKLDLLPALTFLNLIGWIIIAGRIIWRIEKDEQDNN